MGGLVVRVDHLVGGLPVEAERALCSGVGCQGGGTSVNDGAWAGRGGRCGRRIDGYALRPRVGA